MKDVLIVLCGKLRIVMKVAMQMSGSRSKRFSVSKVVDYKEFSRSGRPSNGDKSGENVADQLTVMADETSSNSVTIRSQARSL